jgi:hypothetical protein
MHKTRSISCSPQVIIWKIAFRSAQIPKVEQVSTQTPVYIFPEVDKIAAATSPHVTYSEILRAFSAALAASYISVHTASIVFPSLDFRTRLQTGTAVKPLCLRLSSL